MSIEPVASSSGEKRITVRLTAKQWETLSFLAKQTRRKPGAVIKHLLDEAGEGKIKVRRSRMESNPFRHLMLCCNKSNAKAELQRLIAEVWLTEIDPYYINLHLNHLVVLRKQAFSLIADFSRGRRKATKHAQKLAREWGVSLPNTVWDELDRRVREASVEWCKTVGVNPVELTKPLNLR